MKSQKRAMDLLLAKNKLFRAVTRIHIDPTQRIFVNIFRRDTLERYGIFATESRDKQELIALAYRYIDSLEKPIDWDTPHRYCIARYGRLIEEDDFFYYDRKDFLYDKNKYNRVFWRYMTKRLLKETVLIKKINQLSFEERCQLLTIKNWEIESDSNIRVGYGIFGRGYLYKRLYDKKELKEHYQIYCQKIKEYTARFNTNDE